MPVEWKDTTSVLLPLNVYDITSKHTTPVIRKIRIRIRTAYWVRTAGLCVLWKYHTWYNIYMCVTSLHTHHEGSGYLFPLFGLPLPRNIFRGICYLPHFPPPLCSSHSFLCVVCARSEKKIIPTCARRACTFFPLSFLFLFFCFFPFCPSSFSCICFETCASSSKNTDRVGTLEIYSPWQLTNQHLSLALFTQKDTGMLFVPFHARGMKRYDECLTEYLWTAWSGWNKVDVYGIHANNCVWLVIKIEYYRFQAFSRRYQNRVYVGSKHYHWERLESTRFSSHPVQTL